MKPTRKRDLLLLALFASFVGATIERAYLSLTGMIVPLSAWTPGAVFMMTVALAIWAVTVRRRLMHLVRARHEKQAPGTPFVMKEQPLHPIVAARTVALAFAASRAGALLAGLYAGMAILLLRHWGTPDVEWRFVLAVITSVLSIVLIVVALWLERMCKLPDPPAGYGMLANGAD